MTPSPSLQHIPKCRTAEYNPLSFKVTGLGAVAVLVGVVALSATALLAQTLLPRPDPPFAGTAERTLAGSKPVYPQPIRPPAGAPNILVVLIDDAGFGNPWTFGGPVSTPALDRLAQAGLSTAST